MSKAYQEAGVQLEAGYESVRLIKKHISRTNRPGMMGNIGSFGGMFDLASLGYKEPVLVSGTDGVGTKLKLAFMMDRHDTIGQDAVATEVVQLSQCRVLQVQVIGTLHRDKCHLC